VVPLAEQVDLSVGEFQEIQDPKAQHLLVLVRLFLEGRVELAVPEGLLELLEILEVPAPPAAALPEILEVLKAHRINHIHCFMLTARHIKSISKPLELAAVAQELLIQHLLSMEALQAVVQVEQVVICIMMSSMLCIYAHTEPLDPQQTMQAPVVEAVVVIG
jgi:hypothetical protein